ncbi:hypothetical protein COOONC_10398 [Cooperia oncophora]
MLTQLSNIGQPGIWLFRIDEPSIQPCPLEGQQPPYCQKKIRPSDRILPPRPTQQSRGPVSSPLPTSRFDGTSALSIPIDAPRIIQPQLVTPQSARHNIHVAAQTEVPSTAAPTFSGLSSTAPSKTTRPRPRYESTPHRPIVSLGDRDFEELDPDVFEITFPPFVTVIPEVFTPKEKPKQLPDFTIQETSTTTSTPQISTTESTFPTFKLADAEETLVTVSLDNSQPEFTIRNASSAPSSTDAPSGKEAETEAKGETQTPDGNVPEEEQQNSTELQPITEKTSESPTSPTTTTQRPTTTPSTTAAHIFVFTTTRATTRALPKRPQIVTAGTTTTLEPEEDREAAASKMAIIIPSVIVVVWILLLIAIALFVCCRRRQASSSARLRPYGPVYSVQPTSYALKRNGKHVEGSYEDHLEKAARMSSEMSAYNQTITRTP